MTTRIRFGMVVALTLAFALACAPKSQGPAIQAAESWLALVDAGRYGDSWDAASWTFRKALNRDQWETSLGAVRGPLGKVVSRKFRSAQYTTIMPGAPAGEYVIVLFDATFQNATGMTETVTPQKEADGTWRVSGYYIRPGT